MLFEEMEVLYPSALYKWPQFVLAKKNSNGGDCWVFVLASL